MKKIVSLLAAFLIAISGSVCAFAANSPGGEVKPDQFNVVGTVTKGDEKLADIVVEIGDKTATTDKKGAYRIEGVEVGSHAVIFKKSGSELGKVSFKITKGTETKEIPYSGNTGIIENVAAVRKAKLLYCLKFSLYTSFASNIKEVKPIIILKKYPIT